MKKTISTILTLAMILALAAFGGQGALAADLTADQADAQLNTIFATMGSFKQTGTTAAWRYAVTDLDHNGQLELVAAALHPVDRSNNLKVWELSADNSSFQECKTVVPEGESFPDILTNSADTFFDAGSNTWSYVFLDHIVLSDKEVYDVNCSVTLKDQAVSFTQHAISHTEMVNGVMTTSYMDNNGITISPDVYNNSGVNAHAGAVKSSTNFGWFAFENATELSVLKDSYAVFTGEKEPDKTTSPKPGVTPTVAVPVQTQAPQATTAPVATAAPQQQQRVTYLTVTKNPTNENRKTGDTALFVANATAFDSLTWTFVAPNGGEYSVQNFRNVFPGSTVSGEYSTTLAVGKLQADMSGWGAYCTFYYNGQTAKTSTAYINITNKGQPASTQDVYGSASGKAYHDTAYTVYIVLQNGVDAHVNGSICNLVYGTLVDGSSCTVYYVAHPNGTYDIYSVDIYGSYSPYTPSTPTPQSTYGSMSGKAYSGGGGYAINLSNGTQVYVDAYLCNVSGYFYEGADCTVYYVAYSTGGYDIYSVDIYGQSGPAGGGWAGSNYYENEYGGTVNISGGTYQDEYGSFTPAHPDPYEEDLSGGGWAGSSTVTCPNCGREVQSAYEYCPYCNYHLW
ncbi:MAG: hypothetical protein IJ237_08665 [Oscillospiraceae bacterium]|nr:hypothetical protein [Oscillospiraceae bacterium]